MPYKPTGGKPGRRPGEGGRPAGTKNLITDKVRQDIHAAYEANGGAEYLRKIAKQQPALFLQLFARAWVPQESHLTVDGSIDFSAAIEAARERVETAHAQMIDITPTAKDPKDD